MEIDSLRNITANLRVHRVLAVHSVTAVVRSWNHSPNQTMGIWKHWIVDIDGDDE